MARIATVLLVALVLCACSGDDEGGAGEGGGSGMNAGASGMSSGGSSGASGTGGGGAGSGGASAGSGASGTGGSGSGGGGAPSGDNGQVAAPWDELCVATFTADYDVLDFGDPVFTAKAGDRYLLAPETFGGANAIYYFAPEGPVEFELEDDAQFTSSCSGSPSQHAAVFADTVVYADEALTMELCTLEAGTHAPGGVGFAIAGEDIFTSAVYEVTFTGLESFCDGMDSGFVESVSVTIGTGTYTQIALANVLAP